MEQETPQARPRNAYLGMYPCKFHPQSFKLHERMDQAVIYMLINLSVDQIDPSVLLLCRMEHSVSITSLPSKLNQIAQLTYRPTPSESTYNGDKIRNTYSY